MPGNIKLEPFLLSQPEIPAVSIRHPDNKEPVILELPVSVDQDIERIIKVLKCVPHGHHIKKAIRYVSFLKLPAIDSYAMLLLNKRTAAA